MSREKFGIIDKLPSGNYRARYTGPDKKRYPAPGTYKTKGAARAWLADRQSEINSGTWRPPQSPPPSSSAQLPRPPAAT